MNLNTPVFETCQRSDTDLLTVAAASSSITLMQYAGTATNMFNPALILKNLPELLSGMFCHVGTLD